MFNFDTLTEVFYVFYVIYVFNIFYEIIYKLHSSYIVHRKFGVFTYAVSMYTVSYTHHIDQIKIKTIFPITLFLWITSIYKYLSWKIVVARTSLRKRHTIRLFNIIKQLWLPILEYQSNCTFTSISLCNFLLNINSYKYILYFSCVLYYIYYYL